jgi:hypothetical protein
VCVEDLPQIDERDADRRVVDRRIESARAALLRALGGEGRSCVL